MLLGSSLEYCSFGLVVAFAAAVGPVVADASERNLWDMSFEELLQVSVSTASRQEESVWKSNAAVSVLTGSDLTDYSRFNLAEGLRQADGVDIGRVSSSTWAISSRGLVGEYSNRQLVLVDDRQMYSSLFGGVMWDRVDTFLPDLKQVEIVRGAGGAAWGSNAVHGVINAISKTAEETQGGLLHATIGEDGKQLAVRFGSQLGADTFGRIFVKRGEYEASSGSQGQELGDDWSSDRVEFRVDHFGDDWNYIFQGGLFDNRRGQAFLVSSRQPPYFDFITDDIVESGLFLRANGKSEAAFGGRDVEWNVYLDDVEISPFVVNERRRTWNGFLSVRDEISADWDGILSMDTRLIHVSNVDDRFIAHRENHFDVWKHGLNLRVLQENEEGFSGSFGTRLEYMSEYDLLVLPSAKLSYDFDDSVRVWGSYGRTARFPDEEKTRIRSQIMYYPPGFLGAGSPEVLQVSRPNPELSEELYDVLEVGARAKFSDRFQLDGSLFFERMSDVVRRVVGPIDLSTNPGFQYIDKYNSIDADTYGWEASALWDVNERLRLRGFLGTLRHSSNLDGLLSEYRNYAKYHAFLEAKCPLTDRVNLSLFARYFDARPGVGIESSVWFDASCSFRLGEEAFLTVSGENLLGDQEMEAVNFNRFESSRFSANWKLSVLFPF